MSKLNLYENLIKENLQSRLNLTGTALVAVTVIVIQFFHAHLPQVLHQVGV